jgi:hypothetical protein
MDAKHFSFVSPDYVPMQELEELVLTLDRWLVRHGSRKDSVEHTECH